MTRRFTIRIGSQTAVAELLDDVSPRTCGRLADALPLTSRVNHAKVAGEEFFCFVPFHEELESPVVAQQSGNIGYYPLRQTLCVFYADMPGAGQVTPVARVVDNLEGIIAEGRAAWLRQGGTIHFSGLTDERG
ncbi:cyclophilin-like fold protein [Dactylosporangium sp. CA-092794]|uniref:cyclophilin-like fold protein n=1 Tax=Dactylosporangium sp. CA-092794 TaxID=3239929 RepID=UPI003D8F3C76